MNLKVLLPLRMFAQRTGVLRIVAETLEGAFGFLPHRLDCVAPLIPGILTIETESDGETYFAVDRGLLIKTGPDVLVAVRRAIFGADLDQLRDAVDKQFLSEDEQEREARRITARLESSFMRRFAGLHHE